MITLTESAQTQIQKSLANRQHGIGIRIGVKTTGCSGMAYVLEYVDTASVDDEIIEAGTVKIFVNSRHQAILSGTLLDYVQDGLNWGFEFKNPNERGRCGCGTSFSI